MGRKRSVETELEKQTRLENARQYKRKRSVETVLDKQTRLQNAGKSYKKKPAVIQAEFKQTTSDYLKEFDVVKNGHIHEQSWAKSSMNKFHKSVEVFTYQCKVCQKAWPLKSKPRSPRYLYLLKMF